MLRRPSTSDSTTSSSRSRLGPARFGVPAFLPSWFRGAHPRAADPAASTIPPWRTRAARTGWRTEQRFSPLTQIDDGNVAALKPAWFLELPDDKGLVSTSLVVGDVLYLIGSMNRVRAVDATSGAPIWSYDVRRAARRVGYGDGGRRR